MFNCKNCPETYIGETKRALKKRIRRHKNNTNSEAVVYKHRQLGHEFDWNNVSILDSELNWKNRLSEMIHICKITFFHYQKNAKCFLIKQCFLSFN